MSDLIDDILGPDGAVARRLGAAYEPRPQQVQMAHACREALAQGQHLLVEAGTGVGKSFAYLLPAIELATKQQKRVVISTHTISLQEQLIDKDIPLLASLYPDEFTAVLVKGRGNYLCKRRAESALANRQMLFDEDRQMKSLTAVGEWARTTTDGSLASLPLLPEPGVWDEVRAEHGNCLGKRCTHFEGCFWQAAKRRMNGGNILVVNHALFFSDLALRSAGVMYLPKYDAVIFDEAHTIEDVAGQHFSIKVSEFSLRYQLKQLYDLRKGKGLLSLHPGSIANDAIAAVCDAAESAQLFFDSLAIWQEQYGRSNGRVNRADIVETDLPQRLNDAAKLVRGMLLHLPKNPEAALELTNKADRLATAAQTVEVLLKQSMPDAVYWIDLQKRSTGRGTAQRVTLCAAPVDVSSGLRTQLFEKTKSIVMTSATLCTAKARQPQTATLPQRSTGVPPISSFRDPIVNKRGTKLPHRTRDGGTYAVTFRLFDAIPAEKVVIPEVTSDGSLRSVVAADQILELCRGHCFMREAAVAKTVADAISHFAGDRYRLLAWSVMPNHVHAVLQPARGEELSAILHSIKSFSAHGANAVLHREGPFWDSESYDHLVRDEADLLAQVDYAATNPERAYLEDWNWCGRDDDSVNAVLRGDPFEMRRDGRDAHATKENARAGGEEARAVSPAFAYIARRLGVGDAVQTLQLGSPFDYAKQATLYLETTLPDPNDLNRFMPAACDKIEHYVRHTHGGAFVLFTSFAMLRDAANRLRATFEHLGLPVLVQGVDGTPRQLLQRFRELDDAVLFGTSSFWQGIDVQGSKLRNVILTKLPFAVPDEPLVEAKLEDVTRRGGNAFMDLTLPEAIIRFKQGFGRLIRSKTDKGIVVVLDSRVKTKRYGRQFLDSLPDVRIVEVTE